MQLTPDAKVVFPLVVDEDGWPPVASERLWAYSLGDGAYRLDNVPWFVRDLACGDIVAATAPDEHSQPVFERVLECSAHLTIRIVCFRKGPLGGDLKAVVDAFVRLGAATEIIEQYGMVALDVPPGAQLRAIYARLLAGKADGSWDWEEGRINDSWREVLDLPPE